MYLDHQQILFHHLLSVRCTQNKSQPEKSSMEFSGGRLNGLKQSKTLSPLMAFLDWRVHRMDQFNSIAIFLINENQLDWNYFHMNFILDIRYRFWPESLKERVFAPMISLVANAETQRRLIANVLNHTLL